MQAPHRDYGRPDDHAGFVRIERENRYRWADIALTLGVILMPLGAFLDWSVYPDQFLTLVVGRSLATIILALGLLTRRSWAEGAWFEPVSFLLILSPGLFFCWMIYQTDGSQSLYYFGLILLMMLVQMLGFRGSQAAAYCAITIFAYTTSIFAANGFQLTFSLDFIQGLFFLGVCGTASVAVCSTYRKNRFESYCLNRELAREQELLKESMSQLRDAEQKLVHSEKMRAIAGMAAGLLHEINNPVNYSLMAVKVLKRRVASDSLEREMVDDVESGVTRIADIISDLRTFAHPEHLGVQVPFRLEDAIGTAIRFLTHEMPQGRVQIDDSVRGVVVFGAQSQIVQVLLNLFLNAEKAIRAAHHVTKDSDGQELSHRITIGSSAVSPDRTKISVSDPGIGMDENQLQMVREPFFTTRQGEGLGLGLGICETIVRNHNGAIEIQSEKGVGTVVSFDLPTSESTPDSPSTQAGSNEYFAPANRLQETN